MSYRRNDIKWDDGSLVHACVGDRMVERDSATFLVWTICGKDVPANKGFTGEVKVTCASCAAGILNAPEG